MADRFRKQRLYRVEPLRWRISDYPYSATSERRRLLLTSSLRSSEGVRSIDVWLLLLSPHHSLLTPIPSPSVPTTRYSVLSLPLSPRYSRLATIPSSDLTTQHSLLSLPPKDANKHEKLTKISFKDKIIDISRDL